VEVTKEFENIYQEWKYGNMMAVEAMKKLKMKFNSFYRRVKEFEKTQ
jgi:hypothetical protein